MLLLKKTQKDYKRNLRYYKMVGKPLFQWHHLSGKTSYVLQCYGLLHDVNRMIKRIV